jgi:hypothetical protein
MTNNLSNTSSALVQELTPLAFQKILDDLAASDRSDHRVIVALLTIERECAAAELEAVADLEAVPPVPPPAISTADYADEGFTRSAYFDATPATPAPTPRNHAVAASRLGKTFINGMRKAARRKSVTPKPARTRRAVKSQRPARARPRSVRSPAVHGGARKADDDGDGSAAAPSRARAKSRLSRWHIPLGELYSLSPWGERPSPRRGMTFINASCDCWRAQFVNLFCTNCAPVLLREVPKKRAAR